MKKLIRLISAAIISVAFMGGVANAATCDGFITVTGPSSNNQVSCNDINDLVVNCTNNIVTATVNTQNGASGNGDVSFNNLGGNVQTGTVLNDNGNQVTVGAACGEGIVASTGGGGGGGGGGAPAAPEESGVGEALPDTANSIVAPVAIAGTAIGAASIVLSRLAVAVFRRHDS